MRKILLAIVLFSFAVNHSFSQYNWGAVTAFGGSTSQTSQIRSATDGAGNTFVTGIYDGSYSFGQIPLTCVGINAGFVTLINNGMVIWAKSFSEQNAFCDVVDIKYHNGFIYFAGNFSFYLTLDGTTIYSAGGNDVFLAKMDMNGGLIWMKAYGSTGDEYASAMDLDATGNIYVAGSYYASTTFDTQTITSAGMLDIYTAKFDSNGLCGWLKSAGGTNVDGASGIVVKGSDIYTCGTFKGSNVSFGNGVTVTVSGSDFGIYLAKQDLNGIAQSASKVGQSPNLTIKNLSIDNNNRLYFGGLYVGSINLGGNLPGAGSTNVWAACYTNSYAKAWAKTGGNAQLADDIGGMTVTPNGNFAIVGNISAPMTFGPITVPFSGNNTDVYTVIFDVNGTAVASQTATGAGEHKGASVSSSGVNQLNYCGMLAGLTNFGTTSFTPSTSNNMFFISDLSLGVLDNEEITSSSKYIISPNPTADFVSITIPTTTEDTRVEIMDANGKMLAIHRLSKVNNVIDLKTFENGIYFLKVINSKSTEVKKIVKK
ncbi:MAG: T9SS type A sorting domain-containing protein [Bacteroidetes bacterium]|nr:T9SS type A sorting domain-containing protein [Bacteroidota bacterium]